MLRRTFAPLFNMKRTKKKVQPSSNNDIEDVVPELSWQPPDWFTTLENIQLMRVKNDAPVDTMGCHALADKNTDPKTYRFQILVGLMLSSQTKDEVTSSTMARLIENNVASVSALRNISESMLAELLHPISFYRTKARNIKRVAKILEENYDGDIPNTLTDLLKLPGVGPKMAHLAMYTAWQQITGIGVDTHVHRIANRLKWVPKPTRSPEETRVFLESWLPRDIWADVNKLLVGFGQQICTPGRPKCCSCLNSSICPSVEKYISTPNSRKRSSADVPNPTVMVNSLLKSDGDSDEVQIVRECVKRKTSKKG